MLWSVTRSVPALIRSRDADMQAYQIGIFAEPIYKTGVGFRSTRTAHQQDWPELIKNDLPPEILPRFTQEQSDMIKGSADFFPIDVSGCDASMADLVRVTETAMCRSFPAESRLVWPTLPTLFGPLATRSSESCGFLITSRADT